MAKKSTTRAEADAARALLGASDPLKSKLDAALSQSLPPPVVEPAQPAVPVATLHPKAVELPTRPSRAAVITTVAVPVDELEQADDFVAWLRKESGHRSIGNSTLVRVLLRTTRRDEATIQALREVIALDGRKRR